MILYVGMCLKYILIFYDDTSFRDDRLPCDQCDKDFSTAFALSGKIFVSLDELLQ